MHCEPDQGPRCHSRYASDCNRRDLGDGDEFYLDVRLPSQRTHEFRVNISSLIEMWMGVICTCLPTMHTFVKRRFCAPNPPTPGVQNVNWVALEAGSNRSPIKDSREGASESKSHDHDFATFRSVECDERALASASSCDGESRRSLDSRL